jgi:hypothetical protein
MPPAIKKQMKTDSSNQKHGLSDKQRGRSSSQANVGHPTIYKLHMLG